MARSARPNILCLVGEDTSPFYGCYGDDTARTPRLDRLAGDGVRYRNCFSVAPVCAPSRFAMITGMYPTTCGPAHQMRASAKMPAWLRGFPAALRDAGYYCTNNSKTDYNAPIDPTGIWDECDDQAHWRHRRDDSSFFAVFNFTVTHESALFPGTRGSVPHVTDPASVRLPPYHPDTPTMRADRARFYDVVSALDRLVGERLDELWSDGLADDTIVLHYSDHGCGLPRHKRYCFDSGLRIPLVLYVPPRWAHLAPAGPGTAIDDPVSGIDIPPTVLDLAGLPIPNYMQGISFAEPSRARRRYAYSGRNRMDEQDDMQRTVRDRRYRYIRNYLPSVPYGQFNAYMWRQPGVVDWEQLFLAGGLDSVQRAFWEDKPTEELYDLEADPDEIENLAGTPAHKPVVDRMRAVLDQHLIDTRDNGFIPEGSPAEGYDESSDDAVYPLEAVLDTAAIAIQRDPVNLPELLERLDDPNHIVRFWAVRGCLLLGPRSRDAAHKLDALLDDSSPHVVIASAEALAVLDTVDDSLAVLANLLRSNPNPRVRLQAANALTRLGELARSIQPEIDRAANDADQYVRRACTHMREALDR